MSNSSAILTTISAIPLGKVATYGQIAKLSGLPRAARLVGQILHTLPNDTLLPWHRVINAQGKISLPPDSSAFKEQVARLEAEGIEITNGKVSLSLWQWQPGS